MPQPQHTMRRCFRQACLSHHTTRCRWPASLSDARAALSHDATFAGVPKTIACRTTRAFARQVPFRHAATWALLCSWIAVLCVSLAGTTDAAQPGDWKLEYPPWEDDVTDPRPKMNIPIIGPFTNHGCFPSRYLHMRLAASHINSRDATFCPGIAKLRNSFKLTYDLADTTGSAVVSVSAALAAVSAGAKVIMGPNGSGNSKAMSTVLTVFGVPNLSWASTSPSLSNKANYPLFFRTVNSDALAMKALVHFVVALNYTQCNMLYYDSDYSQTQADYLREAAIPTAVTVHSYKLPSSGEGGVSVKAEYVPKVLEALEAIRKSNVWVVIALSNSVEALDTWRMAYEKNMVRRGWVWLSGDGVATGNSLLGDLENVKYFSGTIAVKGNSKGSKHSLFQAAWERLMPQTERPEFKEQGLCGTDSTVCSGRTDFTFVEGRHDEQLVCSAYGPFAYDAMVLVALALDKVLDTKSMEDVTPSDFVQSLGTFDTAAEGFECLSGTMVLNEFQERVLEMTFVQIQVGSLTLPTVASWGAQGIVWEQDGSAVVWPYKPASGETPQLGSIPFPSGKPEVCATAGEVYSLVHEACAPCPPGSSAVKGASECASCPLGSFAARPGEAGCGRCAAGFVAPEMGSISCTSCSGGTHADSSGAFCAPCSPGQFAERAATLCTNCPLGSYATESSSAECTTCPRGFTTEFRGSTHPTACACPPDTQFIAAGGAPDAGMPHNGTCFQCDRDVDKDRFADGLVCQGGLACDGLPDRTVTSPFGCPKHIHCALPDGCASDCVVPVQHAREVCDSFEYVTLCDGWTVHSSVQTTGSWLEDSQGVRATLGWQNVARLGQADQGPDRTPGRTLRGWTLYMRRVFCAPLPVTDPSFWTLNSSRAVIRSYPQPLLARAGYHIATKASCVAAGLVVVNGSGAGGDGGAVASAILQQSPYKDLLRLLPLPGGKQPREVALFKCTGCPGGHPGQCLPGHTGFNCARCVTGFYYNGGRCDICTGNGVAAALIPAAMLAGAVVLFFALYRMTRNPLASKLSGKLTTCLAMGLTFNGLQTLGVLSLISVDFDEPLRTILNAFQLLLFDVGQLQWECLVTVTPLGNVGFRFAIPIVAIGVYIMLYAATQVLYRIRPDKFNAFNWPHTCNCIGMVLQVLFISICMSVIVPFKCGSHPVEGVTTLVDLPFQVCGVGEHNPLMIVGVIFVVIYPLFGMAGIAYVIFVLPERTARDPRFLVYFKFLVSRFRFDRYYFGIFFMLRNLLVAMVPVINPNNPMLQTAAMGCVLTAALVLQTMLWPWADREVNVLDCSCLILMLFTVILTSGLVDPKTVDREQLTQGCLLLVLLAFVAMVVMIAHAVMKMLRDICISTGRCSRLARLIAPRTDPDAQIVEVATALKQVATIFGGLSHRNVEAFMRSLPDYDRHSMRKALLLMLGGLEEGVDGSDASPRSMRITVNRFKPRASLQADCPPPADSLSTFKPVDALQRLSAARRSLAITSSPRLNTRSLTSMRVEEVKAAEIEGNEEAGWRDEDVVEM